MKRLLFLLLLSAVASAQQLHTFKNGEVADAEKINQNFNYVLENASGGCSAAQQDNSVLLECADGTSGVIAGAGTTIVIPEGSASTPSDSYDSGDIVLYDANSVLLAEVAGGGNGNYDVWLSAPSENDQTIRILAVIINDAETESVAILPYTVDGIRFLDPNCEGTKFVSNSSILWGSEGKFYFADYRRGFETIISKSYFQYGNCINSEQVVSNALVLLEYTPAPEILNAAYPVRLDSFLSSAFPNPPLMYLGRNNNDNTRASTPPGG